MMLDQDARLPFSARLFRVVAWLSAAGIAFSAFCLSVLVRGALRLHMAIKPREGRYG